MMYNDIFKTKKNEVTEDKEKIRKLISIQTQKYLEQGGTITHCPLGQLAKDCEKRPKYGVLP